MEEQEGNILDYLKSNLEIHNKNRFIESVEKQLSEKESQQRQKGQKVQGKPPSENGDQSEIEEYEAQYRKFMYDDTFMINPKSRQHLTQALHSFNPNLKPDKDTRTILSIVSKVYLQELIEESLEFMGESQKPNSEFDLDILEEAHRRIKLKRPKASMF